MTDANRLLSRELIEQLEKCALAQNRMPAEVLRDVVKHYLDEQNWQAFVAKAEARSRAKGLTEDDVPRLISELRRENEAPGR